MATLTEKRLLRKTLEKYEGRVPHMYLDSKGYVTVGVGHLLAYLVSAQRLPFIKVNGKRASNTEIKSEYDSIKKQPFGNYVATFYKTHTKLTLADSDIDKLTNNHIDSFSKELKGFYNDFDLYPTEVRLALFDMVFNLGITRLKSQFKLFNAAVVAKDWQKAANESQRSRPISAARNQYVKDLLEKAAKAAKNVSP